MSRIVKPLHIGISVYDMDQSVVWYEKNLGFKKIKDDYIPPLKARICFISLDEFELELFQYDDPKPLPEERLMPNSDLQTVGTKHVAFEIDNYDEIKNSFLENGVDIALETVMEGNNVMFIRDNSGVLIELIKNN